jgi:predicted transcriptional regulator
MAKNKKKVKLDLRDEIFLKVLYELGKWDIQTLAREAKVSQATLYNWLDGKTMGPRIVTLVKVCKVMGFEIVLKKTGKTKLMVVK